jgi:hypothetical protein
MSITILPTFKGYTVDLQLMKFRRTTCAGKVETIHFLSQKGIKLWAELDSFAREVVDFYEYK